MFPKAKAGPQGPRHPHTRALKAPFVFWFLVLPAGCGGQLGLVGRAVLKQRKPTKPAKSALEPRVDGRNPRWSPESTGEVRVGAQSPRAKSVFEPGVHGRNPRLNLKSTGDNTPQPTPQTFGANAKNKSYLWEIQTTTWGPTTQNRSAAQANYTRRSTDEGGLREG